MKPPNAFCRACNCLESKWKQAETRLDTKIKFNIKKITDVSAINEMEFEKVDKASNVENWLFLQVLRY